MFSTEQNISKWSVKPLPTSCAMNAIIVQYCAQDLYGPAQRAFMCIFVDDLEFQNIIVLLLKQAGTPYCYAHICTSEVYSISWISLCVSTSGGLGWPCSYRPDQMTPVAMNTWHMHIFIRFMQNMHAWGIVQSKQVIYKAAPIWQALNRA